MKKSDLLVCIREDAYCIETLEMVKCPKLNEIVEVLRVIKDEDGTWLCLKGYIEEDITFDVNCFRKATLEDIKRLINVSEEVCL